MVSIAPKVKSKEIVETIQSEIFWELCLKLNESISLPTILIKKFEANNCELSNLYNGYIALHEQFKNDVRMTKNLNIRFNQIGFNALGAAYLLSPKFCGDNIYIDDHKKLFIEYILEIANQLNPKTRHTVEEELKMFMAEMEKEDSNQTSMSAEVY